MKKLLALLLVGVALVACSHENSDSSTDASAPAAQEASAPAAQASAPAAQEASAPAASAPVAASAAK